MQKKSDIEMERARVIKISRTLIRLKHSLQADQEINDTLPQTVLEFDSALQSGELRTLDAKLLETILES